MRINPDCINSISDNGIDISSSWAWVDVLAYSPRYTETFTQPISMEATTLDFCRFKEPICTITIRASSDPTSQILWTGISYNIADEGNTIDGVPVPPDHNTLSGLQGTGPEYVHLANAQYAGLTAGADTALHYHATDRARANHTGTQLAATISDFAPTVRATALTGYAVGANAALAATDTVLGAFGKVQAQLNAKEAAGTTAQYWRGDKSWQTLNTSVVPELTNLYWTQARFDTALGAVKGVANGVCPLDSGVKISTTYLPASILGQVHYEGTWNASTNTPDVGAASANKGGYYITSVAGTYSSIDFQVGDWVISNGTSWSKVDNTDSISSWNGRTGAITPIVGDYSTWFVNLAGSYSNPTWITALDPAKITQTANYRFVTDAEKNTWNAKQAGSSVLTSIATLSTGTGLVKLTNGTASLDTSTYATTTQLGAYLPIANPTFTGTLTGPIGQFGNVKIGNSANVWYGSNVFPAIYGTNSPADGNPYVMICSPQIPYQQANNFTCTSTFDTANNGGSRIRFSNSTATSDWVDIGILPLDTSSFTIGKNSTSYAKINSSGIVVGAEAGIGTYAGAGWSWTGHTGFNNVTTWSGFMQSGSGQIIIGSVTGQSVGLYIGQVAKVLASDNLVSISTSLAVNGAAMPAWGTGLNPIMLGGEAFLYSYRTAAGTQPSFGSNLYYDGSNLRCIATYSNTNYPRLLLMDTVGTLNYLASNTSPTAGATITDLNSKFSVDRSGNGTFAGSLTVSTSVTTPVVYSPSSLSIGGASSLIALSMAGENTCSINLLSTKYVQFNHPDYSNGSTSTDWFLRYTGDTGSANSGRTYLGAKNALYLQNQNQSSLRVDTNGGALLGAWATSYETKNVTSTVSLTLLMTIVTASAVTITIPNGTYGGQLKIIKNASANTITISATGLGVTSHLSGVSTIYIWNGSNWS